MYRRDTQAKCTFLTFGLDARAEDVLAKLPDVVKESGGIKKVRE
jgi:hypothetical protein